MRMSFRTRTVLLGSLLALGATAAGAQQRVDIRRAVTPTVAVRVSGSYAELKIVAWNSDSIALSGTLPKGARLEGGVGGGTRTPASGAKFWIEPSPADPGGGSLVLRVPARARVWVKTDHARISVEGVTGELDLNIISGNIAVRGDPGQANLESMDGHVTVDGSPAWLRVKTADGNVTVRGSTDDLGITTVSGEVTVRDGDHERARVETVTGGVTFEGNLVRGAHLTIETHSGAIEFASGSGRNLTVDAHSLTGRINNMLSPKRPSPGRDGRGEELALELGNGGAQAILRSFKAGIRLIAR